MHNKQIYTEPTTTVSVVEMEGFMKGSLGSVLFNVRVDEYETFDEVTLDAVEY